jgi:hypothetical protein
MVELHKGYAWAVYCPAACAWLEEKVMWRLDSGQVMYELVRWLGWWETRLSLRELRPSNTVLTTHGVYKSRCWNTWLTEELELAPWPRTGAASARAQKSDEPAYLVPLLPTAEVLR